MGPFQIDFFIDLPDLPHSSSVVKNPPAILETQEMQV